MSLPALPAVAHVEASRDENIAAIHIFDRGLYVSFASLTDELSSCDERHQQQSSRSQTLTPPSIMTIDTVNAVTRQHLLIGIVATLCAVAAQAAAPQSMKLTMQPQKGYFTEQCFTLERGQQLAYRFSTRHPVEFNLHHHPANADTVFPDRLIVKSQHSKRIVAESAGAYCFMATNIDEQPGAFDIVVSYEISAQ